MSGRGPDRARVPEIGRDALIGRQLDARYEVVKRLGRGGMSTVYEARHLLLHKEVAVKILREDLAHDPNVVDLIFREARTVARLGHPNIVDAIDVGLTPDGLAYIVLELLPGVSLATELARLSTIDPQRTVRIAAQVASAMTAAHGAGVVHRDLKPDNVFLVEREDAPDHCKVLDFGVAKHIAAQLVRGSTLPSLGGVVGTPGYMAPEQILQPDRVDHRVDVYALGVVMYEMLAGRPPYAYVNSLPELVSRVQNGSAPKLLEVAPQLPPELAAIVDIAMARWPEDRFQTMADLGRSLRSYAVATGAFSEQPWLPIQGVTPAPLYAPSPRGSGTPAPRRPASGTPAEAAPAPARPSTSPVQAPPARPSASPVPPTADTLPPAVAPSPSMATRSGLPAVARAGGSGVVQRLAPAPPQPAFRRRLLLGAAMLLLAVAGAAALRWLGSSAARPVVLTVTASVEGARVALRGQEHVVPARLPLAPGHHLEALEVSAAGFVPQRMELTLDHDLAVRAELRPLPAGEPGAAPAPATGAEDGRTREPSRSRPRTSHPADTAMLLPAPPLRSRPLAAAARSGSPGPLASLGLSVPPGLADPPSEPARADEATSVSGGAAPPAAPPASTATVPTAPPAAEPGPRPAALAAASETHPMPAALPLLLPLAPELLTRQLSNHKAEVDACVAEDPSVSGRLVLRLVVRADGGVESVRAVSGGSSPVRTCMVKRALWWRFPDVGARSEGTLSIALD